MMCISVRTPRAFEMPAYVGEVPPRSRSGFLAGPVIASADVIRQGRALTELERGEALINHRPTASMMRIDHGGVNVGGVCITGMASPSVR